MQPKRSVKFIGMNKERRWLIDAIRAQLFPEFARMGFENAPLPKSHGGIVDRGYLVTHPFGLLRRNGVRGLEQIEIHLAPRGRAAFSISIGVIPLAGIEGILGHIKTEDALVTWLEDFFVLYSRPRSFKPFSVHRSWWSKRERTQQEYEALVQQVGDLLPEVEGALAYGTVGPHIRKVKLKSRT
jgi:hypothetical protein